MQWKDFWKGDASMIMLVAVAINLGIGWAVSGAFDWFSGAVYLLIGLLLIKTFATKKLEALTFGIIGAAVPVIYNGGAMALSLFTITMEFIIIAALMQGVITWFVAKMLGAK